MKKNKCECTLKDDIEAAERRLLVFSWLGVVTSLGIILYSIVGI